MKQEDKVKSNDMKKEKVYNEAVEGDEGFMPGDGYPSCDGQPCVNMADESAGDADTMAGDEGIDDSVREPAERMTDPGETEETGKGGESDATNEWKDKFLRLQAEFDNYRKRTLREKMELVQTGGQDVLLAMLPVRDDVQRAVDAMEKSDDIEALRRGVELISHKFTETLRQKKVTEIEAKGREFDPDLHEAVAKFAAGKENKGKVIDVVQTGYMLGDKVLRFAKVVVGE